MKHIKVSIAIQSKKSSYAISQINCDGLTILDSLIQNCLFCCKHVTKKNAHYEIKPSVYVLVPVEEEDFWKTFLRNYKQDIGLIVGDSKYVIDRFFNLNQKERPSFIVRLTSDCPNVPAMTINKAIFTAVHYDLDYVSNGMPLYRTAIDGHDCEIISKKAMSWLNDLLPKMTDDELFNVTKAIYTHIPSELKLGSLWSKEDLSDVKTSVDTHDEVNLCFKRFNTAIEKKIKALNNGIRIFEY